MICSTLLVLSLLPSLVASLDLAHKGSSQRMARHRRSPSGETITVPGTSSQEGVGAQVMGWWLAGKDCQGSQAGGCLKDVGKGGFASSWKGAKEPKKKVSSSSVKASSTTSSHVSSSSSSRHTSSHPVSSTHSSSSHSSTHSSHPKSSSHASSTHHSSSVHHVASHTSSSAQPAKTSASSSGSCPARKRDQLAFNADGTSKFQANALRVQNDLRKSAGVSELTWSADLAKTASGWANQCQWAKSSSTLGENLAAGYPNIATAIREWGSDDTTDQYAQLLDGQVSAVGCAVKTCDFSSSVPDYDFGPVNFYVCAYDAITA